MQYVGSPSDSQHRDTHLEYQTRDSWFPKALRGLIEWTSFGSELNPFNRYNPLRPFMLAYYGREIDRVLDAELDKRFAERRTFFNPTHNSKDEMKPSERVKSVIALALDAYAAEEKLNNAAIDPTFKHYARAQIRLFLFAGHDTTSSTMVYTIHMLSQHPECLSRIRAEHDAVFGPGDEVGERLSTDPSLLNQLPYTTACIKEALRLYPPASSLRVGGPDTILIDEDGTRYPTEGCNVWAIHLAIQRNPQYWPSADSFIPDRWLVGPDDPLHPPKGGWRPFEFGPRNCIGQTLAMAEIKIMLAMAVRDFDFGPAYDEWDALHPPRHINTALGSRAYQVEGGGGGAHAVNRYPCRVRMAAGRS